MPPSALEPFGAAVIGIGYVPLAGTSVVEHQPEAPVLLGRTCPSQRGEVIPIHRQDVIEAKEIGLLDATRPQPRQIVAAHCRGFLRPDVRRRPDVIAVSPGGIDVEVSPQAGALGHFPKNAFGRG